MAKGKRRDTNEREHEAPRRKKRPNGDDQESPPAELPFEWAKNSAKNHKHIKCHGQDVCIRVQIAIQPKTGEVTDSCEARVLVEAVDCSKATSCDSADTNLTLLDTRTGCDEPGEVHSQSRDVEYPCGEGFFTIVVEFECACEDDPGPPPRREGRVRIRVREVRFQVRR